jgi:hypothetical protein
MKLDAIREKSDNLVKKNAELSTKVSIVHHTENMHIEETPARPTETTLRLLPINYTVSFS